MTSEIWIAVGTIVLAVVALYAALRNNLKSELKTTNKTNNKAHKAIGKRIKASQNNTDQTLTEIKGQLTELRQYHVEHLENHPK